eukprot:gene14429-biopygen5114
MCCIPPRLRPARGGRRCTGSGRARARSTTAGPTNTCSSAEAERTAPAKAARTSAAPPQSPQRDDSNGTLGGPCAHSAPPSPPRGGVG